MTDYTTDHRLQLEVRDMMAMSALNGLLSSGHFREGGDYIFAADLEQSREQSRRYAREAYLLADAMMAARARKKEPSHD